VIALFYDGHLGPNGAATFTSHLYKMLQKEGRNVRVFCIRKVTLPKPRPLVSGSDIGIYRVTPKDAMEIVERNPSFITELPNDDSRKPYYGELLQYGIPYCNHSGPGNHKKFSYANDIARVCGNVAIVNGETSADILRNDGHPNVVIVNHPYMRTYSDYDVADVDFQAIAVGRVSSEKRTDIVCAANQLLPNDCKVKIFGAITGRIWEYRKLSKLFPNWKDDWMDSPHKSSLTMAGVARNSIHGIDLTDYSWDGGRSQYVTLEMMDAGCNVIIHRNWLNFPGEMKEGYNCISIETAEELAEVVISNPDPMYDGYVETLAAHETSAVLPPLLNVILDY